MRTVFVISILFSGLWVSAGVPRELKLRMPYEIVSDEASDDVPSNKVLIKGEIKSDDGFVSGAMIATLDARKKTISTEEGKFELFLSSRDTAIFFYKEKMDEILVKHNFKGGHVVTINFYPVRNDVIMEVDKPVIYMYSDETLQANVQVDFEGDMTFTYPAYNEGWDVEVRENGMIADLNSGTEVPYLFWEGEMEGLDFGGDGERNCDGIIEGFLIHTDTTVEFFENVLKQMGMNDKESTDFITFWAPQIVDQKYALIQFKIDEEFAEKISRLKVSPKPDHLKRVYMVFTNLNEADVDVEVIKQQFESFDRKGFTVLEWGGTELPRSTMIDAL